MAERRKKRILAIFGNVAWMGQERANVFVLDLLQQTGTAECLLAVNDRGVLWHVQPHLEAAGLAYCMMRFCWNLRKSLNPRLWWLYLSDIIKGNLQFYRIWRAYRPDYIHCGNAFQAMTLLPVLSLVKTPIVFRLGDQPVHRHAVERWLWRRLVARVDRFVCNSRFVLISLNAIKDVSGKARVIYNYPPERRLSLVSAPRLPRLLPDVFTVLYLGQIAAIKGVDLLVEAALAFVAKYPRSRFVIAGPTEPPQHQALAQVLIEKIHQLGLSERIIFTGSVEDVGALLALCHVHVCPSVCEEAAANVVFEAKLAQRPSIVFPSGGLPELITHGIEGYVCSGKTSAELLTALEYYHGLPDWGQAQGHAAFASLERMGITRDRFLTEWLEVYELGQACPLPRPDTAVGS